MDITHGLARSRRCLVAVLGVAIALIAGHASAGDDYLLGPQDRVRLKIYEWRPSRDTIFEWTALNDEFTVGAEGQLSLPFVGWVPAEGVTAEDLAGIIGTRLFIQMGLGQAPDVAVEVVQFRPFYVAGHVAQPGEFPFRPGLNVLQAVSIAGGLRTQEDSLARMEREVIASRGEVSLLSLSHVSLLARRARLQAELHETKDIAFPPELAGSNADAIAAVLIEQERLVFQARRDGFESQLRAMTELRGFLERESESLVKQLEFLDEQIASVRKELESVTTLVDQGLAVAPRQMALERSLIDVRSDRLSAETALLRAKQEASRNDISILELKSARSGEVANELREVEVQISEIERRTDTALLLLHDSEMTAPMLLAMRAKAQRAQPVYTILRPTAGKVEKIVATEVSAVLPGDTINVEIPLPTVLDLRDSADPAGVELSGASPGAETQPFLR